jgi:hypothetical protein
LSTDLVNGGYAADGGREDRKEGRGAHLERSRVGHSGVLSEEIIEVSWLTVPNDDVYRRS